MLQNDKIKQNQQNQKIKKSKKNQKKKSNFTKSVHFLDFNKINKNQKNYKDWRFRESHYSFARSIITQFMSKICCFSFLLNWVVCRCKLGIIQVIMISYLVSLKLELEFVKICCTHLAYLHISKPQPKGTYYFRILC